MSQGQEPENEVNVGSAGTHNTDSFDEEKMIRRANAVARSWINRLKCDPSHDTEDLAQELCLLYWKHYIDHSAIPGPLTVRRWAWDVMRRWGYSGPTSGDLKHSNMEISFSRHPMTREYDYTDEELLDLANVHNMQGWVGKYDDS